MKTLTSNSIEETQKIAKDFAKDLKGGEIIAMSGDLGAGKTTFCQYLAQELGVKHKVNSPTFVIMKIYPVQNPRINTLVHIDAYRLGSISDLEAVGATEYFGRPDTVVLIEWAEKVINSIKLKPILMKFDIVKEKRLISIN